MLYLAPPKAASINTIRITKYAIRIMNKLTRLVRFSINPFLSEDEDGFNSYASKPAGNGLAIFLELSVELTGKIDSATGFIINVTQIDKKVRKFAIPVFAERIKNNFQNAKHINLADITQLLKSSWEKLADKFGSAKLSGLKLSLNPFRKVAIDSRDCDMIYFSEKFEFAATHKLWNDSFSEERNFDLFGKCANPSGHGHNYILEVTVKTPACENGFSSVEFEKTIDENFIKVVDHKNLNIDVAEFAKSNPTVENITSFAWKKLAAQFQKAKLHCITVWETDKTYCSYYG